MGDIARSPSFEERQTYPGARESICACMAQSNTGALASIERRVSEWEAIDPNVAVDRTAGRYQHVAQHTHQYSRRSSSQRAMERSSRASKNRRMDHTMYQRRTQEHLVTEEREWALRWRYASCCRAMSLSKRAHHDHQITHARMCMLQLEPRNAQATRLEAALKSSYRLVASRGGCTADLKTKIWRREQLRLKGNLIMQ